MSKSWAGYSDELLGSLRELFAVFKKYLIDDHTTAPQYHLDYKSKKTGRIEKGGYNAYLPCKNGDKARPRPFSNDNLFSHFLSPKGDRILGAYSISPEGFIHSTAVDIDGGSHARPDRSDAIAIDEMQALEDTYTSFGIPFIRAYSRSGTGFHPRIIFADWENPGPVRKMQLQLILLAGLPDSTEIYPKQDSKTNIGNLIALPGSFFYNSEAQAKRNRPGSWLIDDAWKPIPIERWAEVISDPKNHVTHELLLELIKKVGERFNNVWHGPSKEEYLKNRAYEVGSDSVSGTGGDIDRLLAWTHADLETCLSTGGIAYERRTYIKGIWTDKYILERCPFTENHSAVDGQEAPGGSAVLYSADTGAMKFKCMHAHCAHLEWQDARARIAPGYKKVISGPYRPITQPKNKTVEKASKRSTPASRHHVEIVKKKEDGKPGKTEEFGKLPVTVQSVFDTRGAYDSSSHIDQAIFELLSDGDDQPYEREPGADEQEDQVEAAGLVEIVDAGDVDAYGLKTKEIEEDPEESESEIDEETGEVSSKQANSKQAESKQEKKKRYLDVAVVSVVKRPYEPRLSFKTQQHQREHGRNVLKPMWDATKDALLKDESDPKKQKRIKKRYAGKYNTWMAITGCGQLRWERIGSKGTKKIIPKFCERTSLCMKCAKNTGGYYKMWALEHWEDRKYTIVEKISEFQHLTRSDITSDRKSIVSSYLKPAKVHKLPHRYIDGFRRHAYVGPEEMFDGLLNFFKMRELAEMKEKKSLFEFTRIGLSRGVEARLVSKLELIEYLFDDLWLEPAKVFRTLSFELNKVVLANEDEELEEQLMKKLANFAFVDGWHVNRTAPSRGSDMFDLPDKKQMIAMARSEYIRKHPDRDPAETFDAGAVWWFKHEIARVPETLVEEYKKANFFKDLVTAMLHSMGRKGARIEELGKKIKEENARPFATNKPTVFHFKPAYIKTE